MTKVFHQTGQVLVDYHLTGKNWDRIRDFIGWAIDKLYVDFKDLAGPSIVTDWQRYESFEFVGSFVPENPDEYEQFYKNNVEFQGAKKELIVQCCVCDRFLDKDTREYIEIADQDLENREITHTYCDPCAEIAKKELILR